MMGNKDYIIFFGAILVISVIVFLDANFTDLASEFENKSREVPGYLKTPAQISNPVSLPYTVQSISPNIKVEQNKTNRVITLDFVTGGGSSTGSSGRSSDTDYILDVLGIYPIIVSGTTTKTISIEANFSNASIGNLNLNGDNVSQHLTSLDNADIAQNESIAQLQANSTLDLVAVYPLNVTGGATKTLTIDTNFTRLNVTTIYPQGNEDFFIQLWDNATLYVSKFIDPFGFGVDHYIKTTYETITLFTDTIYMNATAIDINGAVNVTGSMSLNGKDIETELVKTSVKSFQADYLNSSQLYTDIIIIPQDVTLTNITSLVEGITNSSSHILNFSIEKYSTYPTSKSTILTYSMTANQTSFDSINYDFSNNDIILLNYTTYTNVSKSSSLFKFVVR